MPVSDEAIARYKRLIGAYRLRTSAGLLLAWDALGSYDEDDVDEYEDRTAAVFAGAKTASVAASAGFFALALGIRPVAVPAALVPVVPNTLGPFTALWHALSEGRPYDEAVQAGRSITSASGFDFVQSTARRTGDVVAERSGQTVRWRRVPGAKSCDWCRTVAGQTYRTAESADFGHDRDDCDVVPA